MKLLNYDNRHLIMNNLRVAKNAELPINHTEAQYRILCNLIIRKKISKRFFDFILLELYGTKDWKQLDYSQTYELIHILTYFDYEKVRM